MSLLAAVLSNGPLRVGSGSHSNLTNTHVSNFRSFILSRCFTSKNSVFLGKRAMISSTHFSKSLKNFCVNSFQSENAGVDDAASSNDSIQGDFESSKELFKNNQDGFGDKGSSFMAKLAIGLGVAATIIVVCICLKQQNTEPYLGIAIQRLADCSSPSNYIASPVGFTFSAFGYRVIVPEYAPGWIYFWLLMAAGCGLFISEEALNIWVGVSLARRLCLDGTWQSLAESVSRNAPYMISTVLWVYWGVCISDMIPFYIGKLFMQTGASDDVCSKLGIGKEKLRNITSVVQRYGNLSGFVERFSVGMRNPTAFLAGAMGVSPECFFAGVCCGGLITLPIQFAVGFLLRERPLVALASVATVVGIWTVLPYAAAALTSLFFYVRHRYF